MSNIPDELSEFVKASLTRGVPRSDIEAVLRKGGWTLDQTRSALALFLDLEFLVPVPRPRPSLDARDAFMYLLLFSTLYVSAFHVGSLTFDMINRTFPDPAEPARASAYVRASMRWSIASLVVAFPVFLYMSWLVGRDIASDPNKRRSRVRRWLTYLTLFVAALALIGDVTTLVYNALGGEITTRFLLKVLTVAVIAGTVFWYYLSDISREL
jgi:hypothetical protein